MITSGPNRAVDSPRLYARTTPCFWGSCLRIMFRLSRRAVIGKPRATRTTAEEKRWMLNKAHLTLRDISHRLGMSRTTVSLAMRDDPRISETTKKRVLAAVKELNYQPNQLARTLATGKSNLVGVVVPNTSDRVYSEIFRGIEDAAQADGYKV